MQIRTQADAQAAVEEFVEEASDIVWAALANNDGFVRVVAGDISRLATEANESKVKTHDHIAAAIASLSAGLRGALNHLYGTPAYAHNLTSLPNGDMLLVFDAGWSASLAVVANASSAFGAVIFKTAKLVESLAPHLKATARQALPGVPMAGQ